MSPFLCVPSPTFPPVSRLPRSQTCRSPLPLSGIRFPPAQPAAPLPHCPSYSAGDSPPPRPDPRRPTRSLPRPYPPCRARTAPGTALPPPRGAVLGRKPGSGAGSGAARPGAGRAGRSGAVRRGLGCGPASSAASCRRRARLLRRPPLRECGALGAGEGEGGARRPSSGWGVRGAPCPRRAPPAEAGVPRSLGAAAAAGGPGQAVPGRAVPIGPAIAAVGTASRGTARKLQPGGVWGAGGDSLCGAGGGREGAEGGALPRCGAGSGGPPSPLPGAALPGASPAVFGTGGQARLVWCGSGCWCRRSAVGLE